MVITEVPEHCFAISEFKKSAEISHFCANLVQFQVQKGHPLCAFSCVQFCVVYLVITNLRLSFFMVGSLESTSFQILSLFGSR